MEDLTGATKAKPPQTYWKLARKNIQTIKIFKNNGLGLEHLGREWKTEK